MATVPTNKTTASPVGDAHAPGRGRRSRDPAHRAALEELAPFEQLARMVLKLRMERDLTQQQLADLLGTSVPAISRLESGQHRPNVETLQKLARACGRQLVIGFVEPLAAQTDQPIHTSISGRDADLVTLT